MKYFRAPFSNVIYKTDGKSWWCWHKEFTSGEWRILDKEYYLIDNRRMIHRPHENSDFLIKLTDADVFAAML